MKQSYNREIIHFEKNTLFWRLENSNFQKEGNKMEDITRETIADETVARMIECKDSFRKSDRLSSFVVARETDLHFLWLFTRFDHYVNILAHSSREEKEREREREREIAHFPISSKITVYLHRIACIRQTCTSP